MNKSKTTPPRPFSEILKDVLDELKITLYRVQKDTGIGTGPLARLLSGETPNPGRETILKIADAYPQINPDFLFFGRGDIMVSGSATTIGKFGDLLKVDIPYLSIKAYGSFIEAHNSSTELKLDYYPVIKTNEQNTDNLLLIEVNGNAMRPTINHGAKVLTTKEEKKKWGDVSGVYAVFYKDLIVIKRIRENELNSFGRLTLYSDNVNGGTVTIQASDIKEMWKVLSVYEQDIE